MSHDRVYSLHKQVPFGTLPVTQGKRLDKRKDILIINLSLTVIKGKEVNFR